MTRHEMAKTSAAGITPPATNRHASVGINAVDSVAASRAAGCQRRTGAKQSGLSVAIDPLSGCGLPTARISRKSKSP
jgi:hypothetical protein